MEIEKPLDKRCEEILTGPNYDIPSFTCPVCGVEATRAHFVADHILGHLRRGQRMGKAPEYNRPIEVD